MALSLCAFVGDASIAQLPHAGQSNIETLPYCHRSEEQVGFLEPPVQQTPAGI